MVCGLVRRPDRHRPTHTSIYTQPGRQRSERWKQTHTTRWCVMDLCLPVFFLTLFVIIHHYKQPAMPVSVWVQLQLQKLQSMWLPGGGTCITVAAETDRCHCLRFWWWRSPVATSTTTTAAAAATSLDLGSDRSSSGGKVALDALRTIRKSARYSTYTEWRRDTLVDDKQTH